MGTHQTCRHCPCREIKSLTYKLFGIKDIDDFSEVKNGKWYVVATSNFSFRLPALILAEEFVKWTQTRPDSEKEVVNHQERKLERLVELFQLSPIMKLIAPDTWVIDGDHLLKKSRTSNPSPG